jgi:ABC-type nitrate/sulfonate/bicarbonate transport system permease component
MKNTLFRGAPAVEGTETGAVSRPRVARRRRLAHDIWPPALAFAAVIGIWDFASQVLVSRANTLPGSSFTGPLPGPWLVVRSTWNDRSNLWPAMWTTIREVVFGVVIAIVIAVVLAIAIDWSRSFRRSIYPLMVVSQTMPIIALAPLVVIWFGFGTEPKIALIALFTFFAIAVGLVQGLASSDPDAMDLLRTMGASRLQLLLRVRLPSALPQFFTGLKVSITFSFVSAILAEYVGATQGLGVYMQTNYRGFRNDLVFGAVIVTALLTLLLFGLVVALERLSMPWRRPAQIDTRW